MAISKQNFEFLQDILRHEKQPKEGWSMLTLGRQHWCVEKRKLEEREYCELPLAKHGIREVFSVDIDKSEGADFVHDLNDPLPGHLQNRFDFLFDGGTLEHCFNPVLALNNAAAALKPGGWFICTKILNLSGHGFWCFTPEFLTRWAEYSGFSGANFQIYRSGPNAKPLRMSLPRGDRSQGYAPRRLELMSFLPLHMQFAAQKTGEPRTGPFPKQAGPTTDVGLLKYLLWSTRLFGKLFSA